MMKFYRYEVLFSTEVRRNVQERLFWVMEMDASGNKGTIGTVLITPSSQAT
jgi:hypothetical protein